MDKKPSEQAETLAKQLQETLRRERPHWLRWMPLGLAGRLMGWNLIVKAMKGS